MPHTGLYSVVAIHGQEVVVCTVLVGLFVLSEMSFDQPFWGKAKVTKQTKDITCITVKQNDELAIKINMKRVWL